MATRYYPRSTGTPGITPAFNGGSIGWDLTSSASRLLLTKTKGATAFSTLAIGRGIGSGAAFDVLFGQWIIQIGALAFTTSDTFKGQMKAFENFSTADMRLQIVIWVAKPDGTSRGILYSGDAVSAIDSHEFIVGSTFTNRKFAATTTPTSFTSNVTSLNGDYLVIEIGYRSFTGSSSRTGTLEIGGNSGTDLPEDESETNQWNPWIEFSQTVPDYSSSQTVTITQPSETDTATKFHSPTRVGRASETDTATVMTRSSHTLAITQPTETDTSQHMSWAPKKRIVRQASEFNSAMVLTPSMPTSGLTEFAYLFDETEEILPLSDGRIALDSDQIHAGIPPFFSGDQQGAGNMYVQDLDNNGNPGARAALAAMSAGEHIRLEDELDPSVFLDFIVVSTAHDAGGWTEVTLTFSSSSDPNPFVDFQPILMKLPSVGVSATANRATETDTANAFIKHKTKTITQPVESDTATAMTRHKTKTVAQPSETDSATHFSWAKNKTLTQPNEADTGALMRPLRTKSFGLTLESDSALTFGHSRSLLFGRGSEADVPNAFGRHKTKAIAQPSEADSAQVFGHTSGHATSQALEADSALAMTPRRTRATAQPSETDSATAFLHKRSKLFGMGLEADEAHAVIHSGSTHLAQPAESDIANSLTGKRTKTILLCTESDLAQVIAHTRRRSLLQPSEADSAFGFIGKRSENVGKAAESDIAQPLAAKKVKTLAQPSETDSTFAFIVRKLRALTLATESDSARAMHKANGIALALESDAAQGFSFIHMIRRATEADSAAQVGSAKGFLVRRASESDTAVSLRTLLTIPRPYNKTMFSVGETRIDLLAASSSPAKLMEAQ